MPAEAGVVWCANDEYSVYGDVVSVLLPTHAVQYRAVRPFDQLAQGAAVEAFDIQAIPALEAHIAAYWYPHYLATVVIAVDRSRTEANISSWSNLPDAEEAVGMSTTIVNSEMLMGAIAYGLEGEGFRLDKTVELLAALGEKGHFVADSFSPPILICFDYQAEEMIRRGSDMEIIIPAEGTLTYEKGLLSNTELVFDADVDGMLLGAGFRLVDGRAAEGFYSNAAAYAGVMRMKDYRHFATVCQDAIRLLRQNVLRIRLYSSKDGRQHQLFVMVYMIIVVAWVSITTYRVLRSDIRLSVLLT